MKSYSYTEEELSLVRYVKDNAPKAVWLEYIYVIFQYDGFYISLESKSYRAESITNDDEVIISKVTKEMSHYVNEHATLIGENCAFTKVFCAKRFLYFITAEQEANDDKASREKHAEEETYMPLKELLAKTVFRGYEASCHPLSDEAKQASDGFCNLAEIGFVFEIDNKYLCAFGVDNCHFFPHNQKGELFSFEKMKEFCEDVQLVEIL
jgi:hypothetical protein